jgi:hypothetical protein
MISNLASGLKALLALISLSSFSVFAQSQTDDLRSLKPREYAERLQNQIARKRPISKKKNSRIKYIPVVDNDAPVTEGFDVGVTFWRLRPAQRTDPGDVQEAKRILVVENGQTKEKSVRMIPARAESETVFAESDLLRLTIEPPFESYLYIISREQYKDGSYSDPYFVFPSKSAAGRNNKGSPGQLLFLPGENSEFKIERLNASNAERIAEFITIVLSRQPLKELPPLEDGEKFRRLDKQQFERWRNEWSGLVWKFEMQGSVGTGITGREKNAGAKVGAKLTGGDPLPQTVYHVGRKSTDILLFDVSIKIGK